MKSTKTKTGMSTQEINAMRAERKVACADWEKEDSRILGEFLKKQKARKFWKRTMSSPDGERSKEISMYQTGVTNFFFVEKDIKNGNFDGYCFYMPADDAFGFELSKSLKNIEKCSRNIQRTLGVASNACG